MPLLTPEILISSCLFIPLFPLAFPFLVFILTHTHKIVFHTFYVFQLCFYPIKASHPLST